MRQVAKKSKPAELETTIENVSSSRKKEVDRSCALTAREAQTRFLVDPAAVYILTGRVKKNRVNSCNWKRKQK